MRNMNYALRLPVCAYVRVCVCVMEILCIGQKGDELPCTLGDFLIK